MPARGKTITILAASVMLAGGLAACGSDAAPAPGPTVTSTVTETATITSTPTASSTAGTTPGAPTSTTCSASDVSAKVTPGDSGAGQRRAALVLTNTSARTCTVQGYPGMQLIDGNGGKLPTKVVRVPGVAPALVVLKSKGAASTTLTFSVISSGSEPDNSACEQTPTSAQVTPPDDTAYVIAPWSLGPVCARGTIKTTAFVAGSRG